VAQVVLKVAHDALTRTGVGLDNRYGNHPVIAQLLEQPPQDRSVITVGTTALVAVTQKVVNALFVEVRYCMQPLESPVR
jgi:hypothetical protein